jgi:hypothetical protein
LRDEQQPISSADAGEHNVIMCADAVVIYIFVSPRSNLYVEVSIPPCWRDLFSTWVIQFPKS